jgi:hypothetical protein
MTRHDFKKNALTNRNLSIEQVDIFWAFFLPLDFFKKRM